MFGLMGVARSAGQPGGAFSLRSLFANGEQGLIYEPWDFASMFQYGIGFTPVTAVGQPVGLILDKRLGLALGSELITNGSFGTDTSGWTVGGNAVLSVDAGRLKIRCSPSGNSWAYQAITTVVGQWYKLSFTFTAGTSAAPYIFASSEAGSGATDLDRSLIGTLTNGTFEGYFIASATTTYIKPFLATSGTTDGYFDNISVKSIAGNHATQATAAARPVVSAPHYLTIDGVDDRLDLSSLSLIAGMDCFVAVNTNTDIPTQALFALDAGYSAFFGVWASGGGSATYGGAVGTPDLAVDGTLLPAATRDDLSSALTVGDWHIIEYRNLDLSTWTTMRLFGGGLPFSGGIGGLVLCPSQDAATRTKVRQWLGNKVGVTL